MYIESEHLFSGEDMRELSDRQQEIIRFIRRFWDDNRIPPTIRDIQSGCAISSTSVVEYNLKVLQREGHIKRQPELSRSIELVGGGGGFEESVQVPLIGFIAAGQPIPVPSPDTWDSAAGAEMLTVPRDLTRDKEDVYALRVKGLSMIDALIDDGDIVLVQPVSSVENGEMAAVWLKAEREVTLKKVYFEPERVRLQPANSQMQPIYTAPDNIEVQGKVFAVIRGLG